MRRRQRRNHAGERGLTLIELLVTISIMTIAFLSLLAAFSTIQLTVGATSDAAQLTAIAREASDVIESESFAYVPCTGPLGQAPTGVTSYQTAIQTAVSSKVTVVAVAQAQGSASSHTINGTTVPLSPINGCSSGPATGPDYGVQQIEFKVASSRHSITRIVYKRWN